MKALKILLVVVASIAALAIVTALLVAAFFDPNDYKGYVTDWVEERTGRPFEIDGDLELAFFPWLAVETEAVTLGNPAGFDAGEPFARIERVEARVRLVPLLERRFEIGGVRLEGLRLSLERGADGRGNWEDFGNAGANETSESADSGQSLVENLDIERIEIVGGEIRWHEAAGLRYVLGDIRVSTGRIRAAEPVDAAIAVNVLDVASERTYEVDARSQVALDGLGTLADGAAVGLDGFGLALRVLDEALAEIASGRLDAESLRAWQDGRVEIGVARVEGRVAGAPAVPSGLSFGAQWSAARFDPRAGEFAADDLVTRIGEAAARWQLDARNVIDAPNGSGSVEIADAPIADALTTFGGEPPAGLDPAGLGTLDASARFRFALSLDDGAGGNAPRIGPYRLDTLEVDGLDIAMLGAAASGGAELEGGVVRATLDVPAFAPTDSLRAVAAAYVPDVIDMSAIDRVALSGRAELEPASGRFSLRDVRADLLGAELSAALDASPRGAAAGAALTGSLATSPIDPQRLAALLGDSWPAALAPDRIGTLAVDARFAYDGEAARLALDDVTLRAFGFAASGRTTIANLDGGAARASGELRIAEFSPRDVLRRFGQPVPQTSDPDALGRASLAARFDADANAVRVEQADLVLDDSHVTGDFGVDDIGAPTPTYRFALAIDRVNADRYLPPQARDVPDDAADTRTAGDIELPAEALQNLRIDGRVTVGELRLAGLDFADVSTGISIGDGRGSLSPARARLYGGEFDGAFEVDTTEAPSLRLTGRASSLRLEPLIVALTGDANIGGIGDFDLDLSGRGATVIENVETANGRVTFEMRDGAIDGFNLGRGLCVVYNLARQLPAPAEQPDVTAYQLIGGTASVRDGVASSDDLLARASFMDLTGRGTLALAEQRLDYALEATLTGSTGIPGCEAMDDLVGESLPLTLRGTVTDPDIRPDFSEIIERRLRDAVRDRLQDRLEDRLRDLLR